MDGDPLQCFISPLISPVLLPSVTGVFLAQLFLLQLLHMLWKWLPAVSLQCATAYNNDSQ